MDPKMGQNLRHPSRWEGRGAKHSPSAPPWGPYNAKPGVLLAVWYEHLWTDFSPSRIIQFEKSFLLITMIFDELSHGGFNFSVRPRELLKHTPVLAHFGVHFNENPIK